MKIALIDSHQIFTESLKVNLFKSIADLETVDTYGSIAAFSAQASAAEPDILITELCFNNRYDKGVDVIFAHERNYKIIVLASISDDYVIRSYMKLGARAYLTKTCVFQELLDAIAQVRKGNLFLSNDIQEVLWAGIASGTPSTGNLSSIERALLEGLSRDEPLRSIAGHLHISMIELKYHRKMLMDRFNLKHFSGLVELAKKPGLLKEGARPSDAGKELASRKPVRRRKLEMSIY